MTSDEIESKHDEVLRKFKNYNEDTATTILMNVASIFNNVETFSTYDEKMKFL